MTRVGLVMASGLLGACGGSDMPSLSDAGVDATSILSLTVSTKAPMLDGLVVSSGEIELEHLSLFGDADHDDRTDVDRITFQLGSPAQALVYAMAAPGLYSRLRTEIDHVTVVGTWRGTPIQIQTKPDERIVDLGVGEQPFTSATSAAFSLLIDGTQWLSASDLDALAPVDGNLTIDENVDPVCVDAIMTRVVASFDVSDG